MNDEDAVEGALREQRALELSEMYFVRLSKVASSLGASVHDAAAAADNAILLLVFKERSGDFPLLRSELAWLITVVRRETLKARRRRGAELVADSLELADRLEQVAWSSPERRFEVMEVLRALRSMPERYRLPVQLAAQNRPISEIAEILGIKPNAAAKRVSRGRQQLRRLTGHAEPERTLSWTEEGRTE